MLQPLMCVCKCSNLTKLNRMEEFNDGNHSTDALIGIEIVVDDFKFILLQLFFVQIAFDFHSYFFCFDSCNKLAIKNGIHKYCVFCSVEYACECVTVAPVPVTKSN